MGRPSKYHDLVPEQARKLCMLGATDAELADFFGISESTLNNWKTDHPEFMESLKEGKSQADAEVASKLYHRATGYSHNAVKIVANATTGQEHIVPYTEHYPPDTTAAIFWLKNRRPDLWRDKQEIDHTHRSKDAREMTDDELLRIARSSGAGNSKSAPGESEPDTVH